MKQNKPNTKGVIMQLIAFLTTICAALIMLSCSSKENNKPDYPLFISSLERDNSYTEKELTQIVSWFDHSNPSPGRELVQKLKDLNPDFAVLTSVNSSYCSSSSEKLDFHTFESKYRHGISMYKCATLREDISADDNSFVLKGLPNIELDQIAAGIGVEGAETSGLSKGIRQSESLSLRASTADGDYSDLENSIEKYVTWIQVGDEFMRINTWDSISNRITVTRGFDGTEARSHTAGSPVLSPVYIGVLGHTWSGYFPGGFQNMIRYALRIDHPDVHAFKGMRVVEAIRSDELDGVWLDIMGYNFFNQSNMHGKQVIPWNFKTQAPYTSEDYWHDQQKKAEGIMGYVEEELGRDVIFLANNFSNKYFPEQGDGRKLLESTKIKPTPLDGLILEGIGGEYLHDNFRTGKSMVSMLQQMIDMEANGYAAFCSSDNNKVRRAISPDEMELKHQHETYAYTAFLMAVEAGGKIKYGIDIYREPSPDNPDAHFWIHPQYFYGIGKPLQSVKHDQVESYRIKGSNTFCREFEHAFVFINISAEQSDTINLEKTEAVGRALIIPETGKTISMLELGAHTGMILMK